jgi:RNA polymerase sigma-70 factor (ECF subfamily)
MVMACQSTGLTDMAVCGEYTMERLNDERLLEAMLAGERDALRVLVERHQTSLTGYLDRLVGPDWSLAQDLCQETFLRVLRQSAPRGDRPFRPWLYTIATNLARDHFKSTTVRRAARLDLSQIEQLCDSAQGPEEHALRAEQQSAIVAAISVLRAEYRAALLLRFYSGMSLQEIADTLEIPLGTVKSRLSVGLRLLKERLSDEVTLDAREPRDMREGATGWTSK